MSEKEELARFGVSFPTDLIGQFDRYIDEQGYRNRSEAFRDLARRALLEPSRLKAHEHVAGTIVIVYDHHVRELPVVLMDIQHDFHHDIVSNMHVHLNHEQCLEVVVVRGQMSNLRELHSRLQAQKGVAYAELSVTYTDRHGGEGDHRHGHNHDDGDSHHHSHGDSHSSHHHGHDHGRHREHDHPHAHGHEDEK